jgi:trigger factor
VTNPEVTDEDLESQTDRILEQFATVEEVDRPAGDGDFVSIDLSASSRRPAGPEDARVPTCSTRSARMFLEGIDEHLVGSCRR